jgi:hypothetical protein
MSSDGDGKRQTLLGNVQCQQHLIPEDVFANKFTVFACVCVFVLVGDMENQAELEEKTRLINQVLELQHTLEGETAGCLQTHESSGK